MYAVAKDIPSQHALRERPGPSATTVNVEISLTKCQLRSRTTSTGSCKEAFLWSRRLRPFMGAVRARSQCNGRRCPAAHEGPSGRLRQIRRRGVDTARLDGAETLSDHAAERLLVAGQRPQASSAEDYAPPATLSASLRDDCTRCAGSAAIVDLQIGRGTNAIAPSREDLLIYRPFARGLCTQGGPEGRELLLKTLRGEQVDWAAIEAKHTRPCLQWLRVHALQGRLRTATVEPQVCRVQDERRCTV